MLRRSLEKITWGFVLGLVHYFWMMTWRYAYQIYRWQKAGRHGKPNKLSNYDSKLFRQAANLYQTSMNKCEVLLIGFKNIIWRRVTRVIRELKSMLCKVWLQVMLQQSFIQKGCYDNGVKEGRPVQRVYATEYRLLQMQNVRLLGSKPS